MLWTVLFNSVDENSSYKVCDLWNFCAFDSGKTQRHGTLLFMLRFQSIFQIKLNISSSKHFQAVLFWILPANNSLWKEFLPAILCCLCSWTEVHKHGPTASELLSFWKLLIAVVNRCNNKLDKLFMFFFSKFISNYKVNYCKSRLIRYFFIEIKRICCMHFICPALIQLTIPAWKRQKQIKHFYTKKSLKWLTVWHQTIFDRFIYSFLTADLNNTGILKL